MLAIGAQNNHAVDRSLLWWVYGIFLASGCVQRKHGREAGWEERKCKVGSLEGGAQRWQGRRLEARVVGFSAGGSGGDVLPLNVA